MQCRRGQDAAMAGFVERADIARQQAIRRARRAIVRGDRPVYHAKWEWDGNGAEIEILELPGLWTIAPTAHDVDRTARHRIALELGVEEAGFDLVVIGSHTG
jgi:hypothetical protein